MARHCRLASAWLVAALAASVLPAATGAGGEAGLTATYLANEGFLVEGAGRRVLVDALFADGVPGYAAVPASTRVALESAAEPWDGIQLALASHVHPDHFDPDSVARFLAARPEARFVSTPQAVESLLQRLPPDDPRRSRAMAVLPPPGEVEHLEIAGIGVDVLNLHHGVRIPVVQNLGFVVTLGDARFLHFGDTEAKHEEFEPYLDRLAGTDLALLPFWFLASEWRADMVREEIRPCAIVVTHLPEPTAPAGHFARWRSYDNLLRVMREAFPDAIVPTRSGEVLRQPVLRSAE